MRKMAKIIKVAIENIIINFAKTVIHAFLQNTPQDTVRL